MKDQKDLKARFKYIVSFYCIKFLICLFDGERIHRSQLLFRSNKHSIRILELNKLALSREDDKRISIDGIASYAMGHYRVIDLDKTI